MANQNIRSIPDRNIRETGGTNGWHEASHPSQNDMNRGRETRAEPEVSKRDSAT
jgi:hypothetical protein